MAKSKTILKSVTRAAAKPSRPQPAAPSTNGSDGAHAKGWSNPCMPQSMGAAKGAVRVWHAAAPTCFWSWGFEGTLHRLRLRYGDQVDIRFVPAVVHTDLQEWMQHNDLTRSTWDSWAAKAGKKMGIPIWTAYSTTKVPNDQTPATRAVVAAFRQGHPLGERYLRELLRRNVVEGKDVTKKALLLSAAKASGLDVKAFTKAMQSDVAQLDEEGDRMADGMPHAPLGFYNLIVEDGSGRTLLMDFAFDPKPVEDAIEFLTARKLKKNNPSDPAAFLTAAGPTHAIELSRAFGWKADRVKREMTRLEGKGLVKQVEIAGHPYWQAGSPPKSKSAPKAKAAAKPARRGQKR